MILNEIASLQYWTRIKSDLQTASDVWDDEAGYPLEVQIDLEKDVFTLTDREHLRQEFEFFMTIFLYFKYGK